MSGQHIIFSPERNQWTLADGRHHMEVPEWAREIMRDEFERETRPLQAENAKLREERDGWKKLCTDQEVMHAVREETLDNENTRLRELVSELWASCPVHDSECDECQHKGGRTGCELYDRMRELGVDDG